CRDYHIYRAEGDRYSAEWVTAAWQRDANPRLSYKQTDMTASELYLEALPLFTRGLVELPDHPTLLRELRLLERTPTRTGRDQVTHPRGCNDDYANAVCGALRILSKYGAYNLEGLAGWDEKEKQMSEPCPIPEGMTFEQYELMSRPVRMGG